MPSCDHTGTSHFHSSTTPGTAALIRLRRRASVLPRQSAFSAILASISLDADAPGFAFEVFLFIGVKYQHADQDDLEDRLAHGVRLPLHRGPARSAVRRSPRRALGLLLAARQLRLPHAGREL